jgi:hypothetical protein
MWKETAMVSFKILCGNLYGGTEENPQSGFAISGLK